MRQTPRRRPAGFTLIELAIVILIIGLIISFVLVASYEGVRRAEERATQSLITKLEVGVSDRLEALLSTRVSPNGAHRYFAAVFPKSVDSTVLPWGLEGDVRAQAIAQIDYIRAELPDVFFVQVNPSTLPRPGASNFFDPIYPLNFAAQPYPLDGTSVLNFILPLGNAVGEPLTPGFRAYRYGQVDGSGNPLNGPGDFIPNVTNLSGTGIYGAAYSARAALMKNLGNVPKEFLPAGLDPAPLLPAGYDTTDNNGNGFIDEWAEGINNSNYEQVRASLTNHTHKTARAEVLYALLIEGRGPLGATFTRDEFTDKEVQDTDHDGLPEFVDAWGQPLQFYRWPTAYTSPDVQPGRVALQKGWGTYLGVSEVRQQNPLDTNAQLVAPAWWWDYVNASDPVSTGTPGPAPSSGEPSVAALRFQRTFFNIVDPNGYPPLRASLGPGSWWDRGNFYFRREFFSRFLIASSGPDEKLGIAQLGEDHGTGAPVPQPIASLPNQADYIIWIENTAARDTPIRAPLPSSSPPSPYLFVDRPSGSASEQLYLLLTEYAADDITNHALKSTGGTR